MSWQKVEIRRIFRVVNGGTPGNDPENWNGGIPWATPVDLNGVRGEILSTGRSLTKRGVREGSTLVPPGSIILSTRAPIGHLAIAGVDMAFNQGCKALVPWASVESRYFAYQISAAVDRLISLGQGSTFMELSTQGLASFSIMKPPVSEQRWIADYLDAETARIDGLIAARNRQLGLIREQEEAQLDNLLAHGLENESIKVKYLVERITSGPRDWGNFVGDVGSPFLRIANIPRRGVALDLSDLVMVSAPEGAERERTRTREGDVLVSITADIGSVALVDSRAVGGNVSQHIALLRPRADRCDPTWLAYALKAPMINRQLTTSSYGGTKMGLGLGEVANLEVPRFELGEQRRLSQAHIEWESRTRIIESLFQRQLELLAERRRALISAAVSGEFDVTAASGRGVA